MSIDNPVGGGPQDPYEKYRQYQVDPVEREKHEKGKSEKKLRKGPQPPLSLRSVILIYLHQAIEYLLHLGRGKIAGQSEQAAYDNLQMLKRQFSIMALENRSQDIEFLNNLARIWHQILELSVLFKRTDAFSIAFRSFVKKVQKYPENQEHTFGYYLNEYTGEKWLPFPYMELVQTIHEQYLDNPETSDLGLWIREIDQLMAAIHPSNKT
jgi:hypothetical protein